MKIHNVKSLYKNYKQKLIFRMVLASTFSLSCTGGNLQQAAAAAASGAQQMGPAYVGTHPFYGSMFYPAMYGPMPAFSQVSTSKDEYRSS